MIRLTHPSHLMATAALGAMLLGMAPATGLAAKEKAAAPAAQTAATLLATELAPATTLPVVCASDPRITLDQRQIVRVDPGQPRQPLGQQRVVGDILDMA